MNDEQEVAEDEFMTPDKARDDLTVDDEEERDQPADELPQGASREDYDKKER